MLEELCTARSIPFRRTGKLVIATTQGELPALDELERRGKANGLPGLTRVGPEGIHDHEPAAVGIDALHVPSAGVADFPGVARDAPSPARGARGRRSGSGTLSTRYGKGSTASRWLSVKSESPPGC